MQILTHPSKMKKKGRLPCIDVLASSHGTLPCAILGVWIACRIIYREKVFVISLQRSVLFFFSMYPMWVRVIDGNDTAVCQGLGETHDQSFRDRFVRHYWFDLVSNLVYCIKYSRLKNRVLLLLWRCWVGSGDVDKKVKSRSLANKFTSRQATH